jgi:hypothetical protein
MDLSLHHPEIRTASARASPGTAPIIPFCAPPPIDTKETHRMQNGGKVV